MENNEKRKASRKARETLCPFSFEGRGAEDGALTNPFAHACRTRCSVRARLFAPAQHLLVANCCHVVASGGRCKHPVFQRLCGGGADDATCYSVIETLNHLDRMDTGEGFLFEVNADIRVVISMNAQWLYAEFSYRGTVNLNAPPIGSMDAPPNPNGLRQLVCWVKAAAKDLQARGPCPKCREQPGLRLPAADYCARCSLKASFEL